jgi:uncharacterized sulfatase
MCEWFDITCGQLMDYIDKKELSRNTLFVYVTDNGWIQDPARPNQYAPRSKRQPYEMGLRTPIIYRWKGKIAPEMNESDAVSSIDIASTIYGICGIKPPAGLPGINVLDSAALNKREIIFAETYDHDFTGIDSSLQYLVAIQFPLKLIVKYENGLPVDNVELFNLENDPHEYTNIAEKEPERVNELRNKTFTWWQNERK